MISVTMVKRIAGHAALLLALAACDRPAGSPAPDQPAADSVAGAADSLAVPLDRAGVQRWFEAARTLTVLAAQEPELRDVLQADATENPDSVAARYARTPAVAAALQHMNTSPREYAFTGWTLFTALQTAELREREPAAPLPPGITAAHLQFLRSNRHWVSSQLLRMQHVADDASEDTVPPSDAAGDARSGSGQAGYHPMP